MRRSAGVRAGHAGQAYDQQGMEGKQRHLLNLLNINYIILYIHKGVKFNNQYAFIPKYHRF